jgi:hypothetical protein
VNAVGEFLPNTVATAKVAGFEFTSPQRTDRFYAKRTPHLRQVQWVLPRPPPLPQHHQDVVLNEVQAQLQHRHHSIHNCSADEN